MRVQIKSGSAGKAGGVALKRAVMCWAVRSLAAKGKVRVETPENGRMGRGDLGVFGDLTGCCCISPA